MTYFVNQPTVRRATAPVRRPFYVAPVNAGRRVSQVPVNIAETDDHYELSLVAPGLKKEAFHLAVEEKVLAVKLELPEADERATQYTRREFAPRNFERRFHLPEQVDAEQISATYQDGILTLTLPKRAELRQTRSIAVQ